MTCSERSHLAVESPLNCRACCRPSTGRRKTAPTLRRCVERVRPSRPHAHLARLERCQWPLAPSSTPRTFRTALQPFPTHGSSTPGHPPGGSCLTYALIAPPVALLALPTASLALHSMPVSAVDLASVAEPTQVEHRSAAIDGALDLAKVIHPQRRPPGIRPPQATCATTLASNASTRGDPGLGDCDSGPFLFGDGREDRPLPPT